MQGLFNALPIESIGQKVAENEAFEFRQKCSTRHASGGTFRQKWQPSFKAKNARSSIVALASWLVKLDNEIAKWVLWIWIMLWIQRGNSPFEDVAYLFNQPLKVPLMRIEDFQWYFPLKFVHYYQVSECFTVSPLKIPDQLSRMPHKFDQDQHEVFYASGKERNHDHAWGRCLNKKSYRYR